VKYQKLLLLPIVLAVFSSIAQDAKIIEQAAVDAKALVIEAKITRDRHIVYCLTALGVARELYQWVPLLRDLYATNNPQVGPEQEKLSMLQALKAGLSHLFYTQEGWASIVQSGVGIGGFILVSKVCEKFVHPDTIRWYIRNYAPYYLTIKMLKECLSELQDPSISQDRINMCNEFVHLLYDRLVRQSEAVCAYMTYKAKYLDDEERAIAERGKSLMIKSQNTWLDRIFVELSASSRDYQNINTLIAAYKADIALQINHFSVVEGESQHDRSMTEKQIKESLSKIKRPN